MKYNELTVNRNDDRKRVGRGISGGQGKTAGRGTKGQKSRTGNHRRQNTGQPDIPDNPLIGSAAFAHQSGYSVF